MIRDVRVIRDVRMIRNVRMISDVRRKGGEEIMMIGGVGILG
jgi:hypothetical protein